MCVVFFFVSISSPNPSVIYVASRSLRVHCPPDRSLSSVLPLGVPQSYSCVLDTGIIVDLIIFSPRMNGPVAIKRKAEGRSAHGDHVREIYANAVSFAVSRCAATHSVADF